MPAASPAHRRPWAGSIPRVPEWAAESFRPTWRALLLSRLIVFAAGAVGVRAVPLRAGIHPPAITTHLGSIGDLLAGSAVRWDASYYLSIAAHGYTRRPPGLPVFFPLYPLSIRGLGVLLGSDAAAGIAISLGAFALALMLLHRLTELELGRPAADATVLLLAFAPLSLFFSAVYTESLFLLLSVGCVLAARSQRWALAGILGALATLTRVTGILLVVPLIVMQWRARRPLTRACVPLALLPAALTGYLCFLTLEGSGWLAPFRDEARWGRISTGPIVAVASAIWVAVKSLTGLLRGEVIYDPTRYGPLTPGAESVFLLGVLTVAAAALVAGWRTLPRAYFAYGLVALLACLSSPRIGQPLVSLDRYLLTIFPLWMVAGAGLARRHLTWPAVGVSAILLAFYTIQFASWSFVA